MPPLSIIDHSNSIASFWVPRAQDPATETRSYSVNGHLDAALKRKGFHLVTGHSVERVLLSNEKRAIGVEIKVRDGQTVRQIHAKKEVVLCAGGVHTPAILQRSGIGPKHILERAGIKLLHELPGVGMNFQDHPAGGLGHSCKFDCFCACLVYILINNLTMQTRPISHLIRPT